MYCKKCGNEMADGAAFCSKCGAPAETEMNEKKFCSMCGQEIHPNAVVCPRCGARLGEFAANGGVVGQKSELAAGLFGIFLGAWGVHNFYLGYTKKAVIQLLLGTVGIAACCIGPVVSSIWGLVEGIMILSGSINTDASGNKLSK